MLYPICYLFQISIFISGIKGFTINTLLDVFMSEEHVRQKAGKLVEEVEKPLQNRKQEIIKQAEDAEKESNPDRSDLFIYKSPKIIGGDRDEKQFGSDSVEFNLSNSLPNGRTRFSFEFPEGDDVVDETHELNRLLNLYNIDPENIGDIIGHRIPLIPVGNGQDAERMTYKVDVPPVKTKPNMLIYRIRRLALRMKLLEYAHTPKLSTNIFGEIRDVKYVSGSNTPPMSRIAQKMFRNRDWESDSDRFVPTERFFGAIMLLGYSSSLLPYLLFSGISEILISLLLVTVMTAVFANPLTYFYGQFRTYVSDTYFPSE